MIAAVFAVVVALSIGVALAARRGGTGKGAVATLVAGRSLPSRLIFFLAVGEIYSIGTMLGFPGGIYAKGASYGIWFIGYILAGYVLGYFLAPLVWRAGKAYDAVTVADVMYGHYRNRLLERLTAVSFVLALVPWAIFQFIGLQTVLSGLGVPVTRFEAIVGAGVIAFVYVAASGMRSTAFVAIVKDVFMLLGIVLAGLAAVIAAKGVPGVFAVVETTPSLATVSGTGLVFAMTTIFLQSLQFYLTLPAQFLFSARSEAGVKKSVIWMPLYMLMYPLLVFAAYYGLRTKPGLHNADSVFLEVTRELAPDWVVGLVAAGAGLAGVLVLAGNALMFSGVLTRNILPKRAQPAAQRRLKPIMAAFLVGTAALTTFASSIMLTFLNLALSLTAQLVPAWLGVLFFRKLRAVPLAAGLVAGCATVAFLFFSHAPVGGVVNSGLIAAAVNAAVAAGLSALYAGKPVDHEIPIVRRAREILSPARKPVQPASAAATGER
ncbi:SSS family transporter [Amycolatopsis sp. AA4]|uniref:sodium:solute symporter family protein n=1 Tax=Actinomycetes TaxID=1760 RepID=UPI0001B54055|nr:MULTISPECIES: hypothetical protein [Actinomycetes]ATY13435.1 SSS family transporter [Amycolatopsis sp. AA4]EFL09369.1 hypothetical protein SSMG_05040 [Streptomyces sp. AA4]